MVSKFDLFNINSKVRKKPKTMAIDLVEQKEFETLNDEYRKYIEDEKRKWLPHNQVNSTRVYEVMYPFEQEEVEGKISAWSRYITPLAEAWWKQRGWGVVWPPDGDNTKSMQVYKL